MPSEQPMSPAEATTTSTQPTADDSEAEQPQPKPGEKDAPKAAADAAAGAAPEGETDPFGVRLLGELPAIGVRRGKKRPLSQGVFINHLPRLRRQFFGTMGREEEAKVMNTLLFVAGTIAALGLVTLVIILLGQQIMGG